MATCDEDDDEVQTPVANRTDLADNIDGGDSAVPALVDKEGDMAKDVGDDGAIHAQVPVAAITMITSLESGPS